MMDIAYCAGLFDGEGCLSTSPYTTRDGRERFHCDIFLGMQNFEAVDAFRQVMGVGSVTRRSSVWMFQTTGAKAAKSVRMILPYLRAKREAAQLFVEFADTFSAHHKKPLADDIVLKRRELSMEIRRLMRVDRTSFRAWNALNDLVDMEDIKNG